MRYIFTLLLICILASCNLNKDRKLSEQELKELAKAHNDSVSVVIDSLQRINIYVPPLYDKEIFDSTTTIKFFELAKATHGDLKLLVNSKLISAEIINILKSNAENNADLLVLMDKTGSMEDDISQVREGLAQVIKVLKTFSNVRLGIALYGDKNEDGTNWFTFKNFETNYDAAQNFINSVEVSNGGDYPESVYEGFFAASDQKFWRSESKRMIILIGDAPPLEKPLSKYGVADVIAKANESNIKMNFYPIVVNPAISIMEDSIATRTYRQEKLVTAVFPNPVSSIINISLSNTDIYSIEIFSAAGSLVFADKFSGNVWKKDIRSFQNGTYMARIIASDKRFETTRFIIYK